MRRKLIAVFALMFVLLPFVAFPKTVIFVKVGFIELDRIVDVYTSKYLDAEIRFREDTISRLRSEYSKKLLQFSELEKNKLNAELHRQNDVLNMLRYEKYLWENNGNLSDDTIMYVIQRDIMAAIEKTSIVEGYSLILDTSGNFVYGSAEINLTDKVLFRLDEKLLRRGSEEYDELLVF